MIIETINIIKVETKDLGINTTDNFIMFYCYYESYKNIDKMISMTFDSDIMNNQINK